MSPKPNAFAKAVRKERERGIRQGLRMGLQQSEEEMARLIVGLLAKYDLPEVVLDDTELAALADKHTVTRSVKPGGATVYRLAHVEEAE